MEDLKELEVVAEATREIQGDIKYYQVIFNDMEFQFASKLDARNFCTEKSIDPESIRLMEYLI
jgi:hypothetical protein